jgi:hypothetical protein
MKVDFIHKPKNEKVIDEVWIGLSQDADGKNGIIAAMTPGVGVTPMVTGSEKGLPHFRQLAEVVAKDTGSVVKIYKFTRAECVFEAAP